MAGFLRRNPSVRTRKPEALSMNRVTAFNPEEIEKFYDLLEEVRMKFKFDAYDIYNVDETGMSTVQDPRNILAEKGDRRVGSITSYERGRTITAVCCFNATGSQFIPPMFIYPRKRIDNSLKRNGMQGALYEKSKNGWINENLFVEWLKHFVRFAKPSADRPVLLILDNHSSHSTIESYNFCRNHHITMLSIPPHTSHRLQPLDLTLFSSLKNEFAKQCDMYVKTNNLTPITPNEISELFRNAFEACWNIKKAIKGFAISGIHPINRNAFKDNEFFVNNLNDLKSRAAEKTPTVTEESKNLPLLSTSRSSDSSSLATSLTSNESSPQNTTLVSLNSTFQSLLPELPRCESTPKKKCTRVKETTCDCDDSNTGKIQIRRQKEKKIGT